MNEDRLEELSAVFITDGLTYKDALKRYKKRRNDLKKQFKGPIILRGVERSIANSHDWVQLDHLYVQDPVFLYFTGLNQYNCAMVLDSTGKDTLFLDYKNLDEEFWEGKAIGYEEEKLNDIKLLLGFDEIEPINRLYSSVFELLSTTELTTLFTMWYVSEGHKKNKESEFYFSFKQELELKIKEAGFKSFEVLSIDSFTFKRLKLDDTDVKNMNKAIDITKIAFEDVCKKIKTFETETDISGYIKGVIHSNSWLGLSFPPIVASGKNAGILHYKKNNSVLQENSLLLMDFGCRYQSVVSDLSRTIPVRGKFNPLQRLLYQIVLDAQRLVEEHVAPGVTFHRLNELCWTFIENALQVRLLLKGGTMERHYKTRPHNIGHLIGHSVHDGDPFRYYSSQPLEIGMVLTNEPGLYGTFEMEIDDEFYTETCGIRIEDQLLITKKGCQNLSEHCPKSVEALENLLASSD
ncbi:MAG: hypothetical protein CMP39_05225 [Rickettsiales bacterium]|nr:hypothetical protein [Rickettsiales bacterium]|tara:strand:- start:2770 stop:4161 length:1392 start_codon:yes stop_codon:yes gene_type:complete